MGDQKSQAKELAEAILRGRAASASEMFQLAKQLKADKAFGHARKLLGRARKLQIDDAQLARKVRQQHALCTYKDPDLPVDNRLSLALEILGDGEDLRTTTDQETLGLAGAIFKRKWEVDGQKRHLERSLNYYLRGYQQGPETDQGYTGINAAYVLDLLASLEASAAKEAGSNSAVADARRQQAREIREQLVKTLPAHAKKPGNEALLDQWWFLVTVAEAYFGLKQYGDALRWLKKASELKDVPPWEYESTARQLASLARLQEPALDTTALFDKSEAGVVLREFLGEWADGARTAFIGKVGLALSGGGFRASLFHIGVLARLAELDVLRHVEVLSCVSGGSILGAHYYLEVRRLLESKPDNEVTREDYIQCVKNVEKAFLSGVQKNIRTRVAAEFLTNLRMIWDRNYSPTKRGGELYEKFLYSGVEDEGGTRRWLTDLYVHPTDEAASFRPKYDNWRRKAKVPILILNATTLNTGHNWQFTASWMGEPPTTIDPDIDGNYRLRRMYYSEAPKAHRKIRLGHAVAASAAVPGLFEPISLSGLYPDITVQLADGGVHDNQGIVGLLEQDCNVLLVSDASGQMGAIDNPGSGPLSVPLRSNSILMARVREAEYDDLVARRASERLRGLMFVHLKKDLDVDPIDWIDCKDPIEASEEARPAERRGPLTRYGILKDMQRKLAAIRTDLDSFSDAEAFSLMASGYRMTEFELARSITSFPVPYADRPDWRFLQIEPFLSGRQESSRFAKLLDVAGQRAFKVFRMSPVLKVASLLFGLAGLAGLGWLFYAWRQSPVLPVPALGLTMQGAIGLTLGMIGLVVAGAALLIAGGKLLMKITRSRYTIVKVGLGFAMALIGWIFVRLHLHVFDKLFLWYGSIKRLARSE